MRIPLSPWLFLIPLLQICIGISIGSVSSQCPTDQSSLLFQLQNTLKFNPKVSTKLINWTQTIDCCDWKGVTCNKQGQVTGLDLNSESIIGGIDDSSSLFSLQFLKGLNLAFNSFNTAQIPPSFANLTQLEYLNLSNAGFSGQIPIEILFLTRLVTLDLSSLSFPGSPSMKLENPNLPALVGNLTGLKELLLDGVNISSKGREWGEAISSSLPNLKVLSLSNCFMSGPIDSSLQKLHSLSEIRLCQNNLSDIVPDFFANFLNLEALHLSSSNLHGLFPEKILQIPKLKFLDLSNNELLHGLVPVFRGSGGSLHTLVLSHTNFSGTLPDSVGKLRMLSRIELSGCKFSGRIPKSMANLTQLVHLDLSCNNFSDPITSFQMSKNLNYIDLSHNALTGRVPSTYFEGLSNLVDVNLAYNSFNGSLPYSLFSLPLLRKMELSNNKFGGEVTGFSNESLPPLDTLDLSSNKLQGYIPPSFFELGSLNRLLLSFNNFTGTIELEIIERLQNLTTLELSYNSLTITRSDSNLSLSFFPQLRILKLASCKLNFFPDLKNQSRMSQLDLSDNQITGVIHNWIWNVGNGSLMYLNLSCNLLVGLQNPYVLPRLSVLDLHSNHLRGEIPIPPPSAAYVDYSRNNFSLSIPPQIGNNLTFSYFFSVSSNSLSGTIPKSICNANFLNVLDLSNNNFSGAIPQCLIERSAATLRVLNFQNNNLSGKISGTFPQTCALRTLDINSNHLEGKVPESLAKCTALEVLNLGNNEINDGFPCLLKNLSNLCVLVLRSNRFQGGITDCRPTHGSTWPKLQIVDLASNNFTGPLPGKILLSWKMMTVYGNNGQSDPGHLRFPFLTLNNFYYQDTVTVTNKGLEMKLVKILTLFTSIDISCNNFQGAIPNAVGVLKSLYVLNLSHNALTGPIPSTIGNLTQLGSLDLSQNKLNGSIPTQLARLTFLSFLNLSYNQLVGMIPIGSQIQTFSNTSFEGNKGLCGKPLNENCNDTSLVPPPAPSPISSGSLLMTSFHWQFILTGLGFGLGAGIIVGAFASWKQGSNWCDKHIEKFISMFLPTLGFIFRCCNDVKMESKDSIEEETLNGEVDCNRAEDEDEMEVKEFAGQYCVFCSKIDIRMKKAMHHPKCTCHGSPLISSFSLSSPCS